MFTRIMNCDVLLCSLLECFENWGDVSETETFLKIFSGHVFGCWFSRANSVLRRYLHGLVMVMEMEMEMVMG